MQAFHVKKKQDMQDRLRWQDTQDELTNLSCKSCREAILHILFLFTSKISYDFNQV